MSLGLGKVALLLPGGGSRGIFQPRMYEALEQFGIHYDAVFSSSVGTLNALKIHAGDLEGLKELWLKIKTSDVYKTSPASLFNAFNSNGSIYDSTPLRKLLDNHVNEPALRNNANDFFINTTSLTTASPLTLSIKALRNKQEIRDFCLASASPPIYFPPVKFRDHELIDSGVCNNYGIIDALKENCDTLIVLSGTKHQAQKVNNILDMLGYVLTISTKNYLDREIRAVSKINSLIDLVNENVEPDYRKVKLITITVEQDFGFGFLDFDYKGLDRKVLMNHSYDVAMRVLSKELDGFN